MTTFHILKLDPDDPAPSFAITIHEVGDVMVKASFWAVDTCSDMGGTIHWLDPERWEPSRLFEVTIKWDGCSHIHTTGDGYAHVCGAGSWRELSDAIGAAFNYLQGLIEYGEPGLVDGLVNPTVVSMKWPDEYEWRLN